MFKYLMWIFYEFVDISLYLIMATALFEENMNKHYKNYFFLGGILLLFCIGAKIFTVDILTIAPFVIVFLASRGSIIKRIWIVLLTVAIILVLQQFVTLIMNPQFFISSNMYTFDIVNVYMGLVVLIVAGIIKFVKMKKVQKIHFDDIPSYIYTNIILGLCAGVFPLTIINYLGKELLGRLYYLIMIVSYLGLICSTVTVILFIKNFQEKNRYFDENKIKDQLLEMQKEYYDKTVKNYEYIRSFKHDIKAHLRVLLQLEKNQNYQELHNHLEQLQDNIQEYGKYKCSNIYIASVINSFDQLMTDSQIEMSIEYSVNGKICIDSVNLCSLFHNLLSNAITEESKIDYCQRKIVLSILNVDNHLKILITNHVNYDFDINNIKNKLTTKVDNREHGIGLYNIQKVVNQYNGKFIYNVKNNCLTICVILQDVVNF